MNSRQRAAMILVAWMAFSTLLSSCSMLVPDIPSYDSPDPDRTTLNIAFDHVVRAIQTRDKAALRDQFSKLALGDATDFDARVNVLFDFVRGRLASWQMDDGGAADVEETSGPMRRQELQGSFTLVTDKDVYWFVVFDVPVDEIHDGGVGLYGLAVMRLENANKYYTPLGDLRAPGISFPPPS